METLPLGRQASMRLESGSRVAIVGGGPAGSFTALHLIQEAEAVSLRLEIQIYEGRDFSQPGPGGCNKCAGVLSSSFVQQAQTLGLEIPEELVQAVLDSYTLHFGRQSLRIQRGHTGDRVLSVYRGSGPRLGTRPNPESGSSFDGWLLEQARQRGAEVVRRRVDRVLMGTRPRVVSGEQVVEADLVVVATGINTRSPLEGAWGYQPPRTAVMAQNETIAIGTPRSSSVHIYFNQPSGLLFGALVPKGEYTNISLLGENLPPRAVEEFLKSHRIAGTTADGAALELPLLCGCAPKVAISAAEGYYADRMVVVGDAAATRLYKNGIGSAFATAGAAARCAVRRGVGAGDFDAGYRPACAAIAADNRYGRVLFEIWKLVRDTPALARRWQAALVDEEGLDPERQVHRTLLWHMFTGDQSYAQIFWLALSWPSVRSLLRGGA